jgi:hypothetical protein
MFQGCFALRFVSYGPCHHVSGAMPRVRENKEPFPGERVMSTVYDAREFVSKLNAGKLKKPLSVTGFVKACEKSEVVLFSGVNRSEKWIEIPLELVKSVEHYGEFNFEDHARPIVKLFLQLPDSKDNHASFLLELIGELSAVVDLYESLLKDAVETQTRTASCSGQCGCSSKGTLSVRSDRRLECWMACDRECGGNITCCVLRCWDSIVQ